jgi:hypothetical protein
MNDRTLHDEPAGVGRWNVPPMLNWLADLVDVDQYAVPVVGPRVWWAGRRRLIEQRRRECTDMSEDLSLELGGFYGCRVDSVGEAAQHEPGSEFVGFGHARAAKPAPALEQPSGRQQPQAARGAGQGR